MDGENGKRGYEDNGFIYPLGSEFCKDVYCTRCVHGNSELRPHIGAILDLPEVW